MDGFDDLLAPSRSALEDNPFADPFAKRSGSPDPWASPFAVDSRNDSFTNSYATSVTHHEPNNFSSEENEESLKSPLENVEEEKHDQSESPGFRESIPTFSETATIRHIQPEDLRPLGQPSDEPVRSSTPTSKHTTSNPSSPAKDIPQASQHVIAPSESLSSSKQSNDFVTPLERSTPLGFDQSMAGLSLGADVLGTGWQSEQTTWGGVPVTPPAPITPVQADDDSDDDTPIGQTLRNAEKLVSHFLF